MMLILMMLGIMFATFTQSVSGFGLAIVATPLLHSLGLPTVVYVPLIAVIGLMMRPIMIAHYWRDFRWQDIWQLSVAAVVGVPLGMWLFKGANDRLVNALLGIIIISYALYMAYGYYAARPTRLLGTRWAWGIGFVSGLLGGAFNIFGPPTIIYANGRNWQKETFKANLQAFALLMSIMISGTHLLSSNITPDVVLLLAITLPLGVVGMLLGFWLDPYIPRRTFNYLVLVLLIVTGLGLIL